MTTKIHRIAIAAKDIDVAIAKYSKMFGANFVKTADAVSMHVGVYVASDWTMGIELALPVPGSSNPVAIRMEKFLADHGEGVFGTAFVVDDMATAVEKVGRAGVEKLMPTFGFTVAFCLFEPN